MAQKKMGYSLYVNGPYKQRDGSAITATSTDVDGGSAKNVGTSSSNGLRNSALGLGKNESPKILAGVAGGGVADCGSFSQAIHTGGGLTGVTAAAGRYAGLAQLNVASHPFQTGSPVHLKYTPDNNTGAYNGWHRVVAVPDANSVVLNRKFFDTQTGILYATGIGPYAGMTAGAYTMRRFDGVVHGRPSTILRSAASDFGRRKVHAITALRSTLVATAIRSGYYDIFTGRFDRGLTTQNDYNSFDTQTPSANLPDDEAQGNSSYSLNGEFNYRAGGYLPVSGDYEVKHT